MKYLQRLFWGLAILGIITAVCSIGFVFYEEPIFAIAFIGAGIIAYMIGHVIDKFTPYNLP